MQDKKKYTDCSNSNSAPIFILGVRGRSGTHFLFDLISLHPDCTQSVISEDYFINQAGLLIKCANDIYNNWPRNWRVRITPPDSLYRCLGDSLVSFLNLQLNRKALAETSAADFESDDLPKLSLKRLVTKSPSVDENLPHFFNLFPRACLLIIVRDGRAVVESLVKSFDCSYEVEIHRWAKAVRILLQFEKEIKNTNHKCLIVKYEDIYNKTEKELRRIFSFLGLDSDSYDFKATVNLPVRGSSELRAQGKKMHWRPVEKAQDFNPIMRWRHWDRALHERFNWIAGDCLEQFGYTKQTQSKNQFLWIVWNILLDIIWKPFFWLKVKQNCDRLNRAKN